MTAARLTLLMLCCGSTSAVADVEPVAVHVPEANAWVGQKVSFYIELRASGTFDGTADFSLPEIPRSVIIRTGNPVVSSKEIEGESWFIQTHQFALFSQQSGKVTIPAFEVRFASRDGFTGPVIERKSTVPEMTIEIQRPPGSERLGFLITTASLDVSETWNPQPGPANVGDVFKRTISQHADQMTGIALSPPPDVASGGVRTYFSSPEVIDHTERGDFTGERTDTITYVLQEPGSHTLPVITYVWWNPKTEELRSKTLPSVTFDVAAPPTPAQTQTPSTRGDQWIWWSATGLLLAGLVVWQRERIAAALEAGWHRFNPPDRVAARRLLRACRRNDTAAASSAWLAWLERQEPTFSPPPDLRAAVVDLQRHRYGPTNQDAWQGAALAHAFRRQLAESRKHHRRKGRSELPRLNPAA